MISQRIYVPILKWRQGEYQALAKLTDEQKASTMPLIEVTAPDFDFETQEATKTLDKHLENFARRVEQKWGRYPIFIDVRLIEPSARMATGVHPLRWLLDEGRDLGLALVPVAAMSCDSSCRSAVMNAHLADGRGAAIRLTFDDAADPQFSTNIERFADQLRMDPSNLDLIIDLRAPNFDPIRSLADLIARIFSSAPIIDRVRSVTLASTSFPSTMAGISGPLQFRVRQEWLLYKVIEGLNPAIRRMPAFGDYAVASPDLPQVDMRLMKPSANIRYCTEDGWLIAKGSNVRDNGFEQYRDCCQVVVGDPRYLGRSYSPGSEYIYECGFNSGSTGNLSTWRWVGTNQHLVKTINDIANLFGP